MDKEDPARKPQGTLLLRTLAMPKNANANGDIFGGWIMSQMDIGGSLLAAEASRGRVTTVSVDKMVFKYPVHIGDTICLYGRIMKIGNTSMDIDLEVWAKDPLKEFAEERHLVTEGIFRYVAIDDNGRPRPVRNTSSPQCC